MQSKHSSLPVIKHCQLGYNFLNKMEWPWPVPEVAHQHRDRLDGAGYPQRLKGDVIILEARIIAAADVVEAMASNRSYRPALSIDKVLAEIERGRWTTYDASVVDACIKLFRERNFGIPD